METALYSVAASILAASAYTDLRWRRIDNRLVLSLAALAALRALLFATPAAAALSALGGLVVGALLTPLFLRGWLGGGDLKLIVAGCWFLGLASTPSFLLAIALCGGALALAALGIQLCRAGAAAATLPYGVAIAGGGGWTMLAPLLHR